MSLLRKLLDVYYPMKIILSAFITLVFFTSWAQKDIQSSDQIEVVGKVKKQLTITIADLEKFEAQKIDDVTITNHLGEKRSEAKNMKGVLLKDVLANVDFDAESPKVLSEFYLACIATDGYKVVFSWNELFNTEVGNHVFIITEKDGKKIREMSERLLIMSPTDFKTGRRNIKGVRQILIGRTE